MYLENLLLGSRLTHLTNYFSISYLAIFLPLSMLFYSLTPQKGKKYTLLILNLLFFWLISSKLVLVLAVTILSVHYFGLWLDRLQNEKKSALKECEKENKKAVKNQYQKRMRAVVSLAAVVHIGMLLVIKYTAFFTGNINSILAAVGSATKLAIPKYVMPVGISFFTMQAMSYIFDVYRGKIKADGNLVRVALFISFFPQIVEGPICRYSDTADKLWNVTKIDYDNLASGIRRLLFGLMKKAIVADRLNAAVASIFTSYNDYDGGIIALGAVLYTIQLYMDFSGSMDAVTGTGQIFGVIMPENFQRPFFSKSVSEFWKRWHITLGTWFRDYIFYPVSMSKPMKKLTAASRKKLGNRYGPLTAGAVALFCVWSLNGLWHGAAWSYIFYGMYHFVMILTGNIVEPLAEKFNKKLHLNPENFFYKWFKIIRTTVFVIFGELFFRAPGLDAGFKMCKIMFTSFTLKSITLQGLNSLKLDKYDLIVVGITLAIVFTVSILKEHGKDVNAIIAKQKLPVRWIITLALILFIVICAAYGTGYAPVDPMYADF